MHNWGTLHSPTLDEADAIVRADIAERSQWGPDGFDVVISVMNGGADPDGISAGPVPPLSALRALLGPFTDMRWVDLLIDVAIEDALETGSAWKLRYELDTWLHAGILGVHIAEVSRKDRTERTAQLEAKAAEWLAEQGDAWGRMRAFMKDRVLPDAVPKSEFAEIAQVRALVAGRMTGQVAAFDAELAALLDRWSRVAGALPDPRAGGSMRGFLLPAEDGLDGPVP